MMHLKKNKAIARSGMTMVELMVTVFIAMIVLYGLGVYVVGMHRGFWNAHKSVHGNLVRDAYVARRAFDGIVRKGAGHYAVNSAGDSIAIDYWSKDSLETMPDCRAIFSVVGDELRLACGPVASPSTQTICANVSDCKFYVTGDSVQMMLTLEDDSSSTDDDKSIARVFSSAVQHN